MKRHAADGFAVIGVNTDQDEAKTKERCAKEEITWANILDGNGKKLTQAWGVSGFPSAWLIDREGVIRKKFLGIDPEELDKAVEELMSPAKKEEPKDAPRETALAAPKFAAPVQIMAGEVAVGEKRNYPSPVYHDVNGDGLMDIVTGDLPGRLTVAERLPGEGVRYAPEQKMKAVDGKEIDFHNW